MKSISVGSGFWSTVKIFSSMSVAKGGDVNQRYRPKIIARSHLGDQIMTEKTFSILIYPDDQDENGTHCVPLSVRQPESKRLNLGDLQISPYHRLQLHHHLHHPEQDKAWQRRCELSKGLVSQSLSSERTRERERLAHKALGLLLSAQSACSKFDSYKRKQLVSVLLYGEH